MPNADLKLDGANAIVEGNWLLVKCLDIKLDAASRRSQPGGERRALVHGFSDELVVNWAEDYPGGVTIAGDIHIPGKIKENKVHLEANDLLLDHPDRRSTSGGERRALVHGFSDELVLNWGEDYPGGVTIRGDIHIPGKIKQNKLRLEANDLLLDHPDRRSTSGGQRRALVHGFNDELVLNYAKDYPGGTVVHGDFEIQKGGKLQLKNPSNDVVVEGDRFGNLTLGGGSQDGDLILKDGAGNRKVDIDTYDFTATDWPAWPGESSPSSLELIKELRRMKEEILALRAEVDALSSP